MASTADLLKLRRMTNETDSAGAYSDEFLNELIDRNVNNLNASAAEVWTLKAAATAGLVDITESGSSRKMSSMYSQALEMVRFYSAAEAEDPVSIRNAPRSRAIERA